MGFWDMRASHHSKGTKRAARVTAVAVQRQNRAAARDRRFRYDTDADYRQWVDGQASILAAWQARGRLFARRLYAAMFLAPVQYLVAVPLGLLLVAGAFMWSLATPGIRQRLRAFVRQLVRPWGFGRPTPEATTDPRSVERCVARVLSGAS